MTDIVVNSFNQHISVGDNVVFISERYASRPHLCQGKVVEIEDYLSETLVRVEHEVTYYKWCPQREKHCIPNVRTEMEGVRLDQIVKMAQEPQQ